jgi:hypothetical protein
VAVDAVSMSVEFRSAYFYAPIRKVLAELNVECVFAEDDSSCGCEAHQEHIVFPPWRSKYERLKHPDRLRARLGLPENGAFAVPQLIPGFRGEI